MVKGDSQFVINQVSKEYQYTDPQMAAYVAEVQRMERHFDGLELRHVQRFRIYSWSHSLFFWLCRC
jgi:isocitrate lyase